MLSGRTWCPLNLLSPCCLHPIQSLLVCIHKVTGVGQEPSEHVRAVGYPYIYLCMLSKVNTTCMYFAF